MTLAEVRRLFEHLCEREGVTAEQVRSFHRARGLHMAKLRIIYELKTKGADFWHIAEIIGGDKSTLRHRYGKAKKLNETGELYSNDAGQRHLASVIDAISSCADNELAEIKAAVELREREIKEIHHHDMNMVGRSL